MTFSTLVGFQMILTILSILSNKKPSDNNWPQFRGASAKGVASGASTAELWDVEKSQNVRWKTPIPGLGHSSPVVWGDRIFLTSAVSGIKNPVLKVGLYGESPPSNDDDKQRWVVLCIEKNTGKVLWEKIAASGVPKVKRHPKGTHANPSIATDGQHVVAFFGSEGLYCYDPTGKLLWKKDLGVLNPGPFDAPELMWGFASSPIIHDGMVIVQCDVFKDPFLAAIDIRNGKEIWRTKRDDVCTWSTPTVDTTNGRNQVIVNGWKHIGGYDLKTGKELWRLTGGGDIPVPAPVVGNGLIYVTNAHGRMAPVYAIKCSAVGDISLAGEETSNANVAWFARRDGAYMATPLVYGAQLYIMRINGILICYEAATGKKLYEQRLAGGTTGFSASPVASDGKVYISSEDGDIFVIKAGSEYKLLAKNSMGDITMATPAISQGVLYFRTRAHLIAISDSQKRSAR